MKTQFLLWILLAALLSGCDGCRTKTPNPLTGFHHADEADMHKNRAITDDCKTYIHTLSSDEQKYAGSILFYEDGTGRHAVEIQIGLDGTVWLHVLLYDKDDKRIKTIKYSIGHYAS